MFMISNWIFTDILPENLFNPFDSMFAILIALFWHFRLRVKLTSCRWMKLAFVIVSVCQMVHHQKYPVKSQTKSRLELFSDTAKHKSLLTMYISLYIAVPDSSLFICDLTHAYVLCKARIGSINICGTAKTILTRWEFSS